MCERESKEAEMAPRSLILHRLTPYFAARIRQNQRLLSSYSSSALQELSSSSPSSSPSPSLEAVGMTEKCIRVLSLCFQFVFSSKKLIFLLSDFVCGLSGFFLFYWLALGFLCEFLCFWKLKCKIIKKLKLKIKGKKFKLSNLTYFHFS